MILYSITLAPLVEDLRATDPALLAPFYTDDAEFDGLDRQISHIMKLILEQGSDQGYLPDPSKYLFIVYSPAQEALAQWEFKLRGAPYQVCFKEPVPGGFLGFQGRLRRLGAAPSGSIGQQVTHLRKNI